MILSDASPPLLAQEAEALHAEVQILNAEAGQLRRDNELKMEMEAQCARRGVAQVRGICSCPSWQRCINTTSRRPAARCWCPTFQFKAFQPPTPQPTHTLRDLCSVQGEDADTA